MTGQEKEIIHHLTEDDLDRLLTQTNCEKMGKRLIFIKRLYKGATLEDAADDVRKSQSTSSRWVDLWNKGGLGKLTPNFGGGPRSSVILSESVSSNSFAKANPGRNRRYSTS